MVSRTPLQLVKEAKQIARDHGMRVAECQTPKGIDYILYRLLPSQGDIRLGKRSSPEGIRSLVARCANFH